MFSFYPLSKPHGKFIFPRANANILTLLGLAGVRGLSLNKLLPVMGHVFPWSPKNGQWRRKIPATSHRGGGMNAKQTEQGVSMTDRTSSPEDSIFITSQGLVVGWAAWPFSLTSLKETKISQEIY